MIKSTWSDKVKTKFTPKENIFKQSAEEIADYFYANSSGLKQAMARINFYMNRAGKNLSDGNKQKLNLAKELLRQKYQENKHV